MKSQQLVKRYLCLRCDVRQLGKVCWYCGQTDMVEEFQRTKDFDEGHTDGNS